MALLESGKLRNVTLARRAELTAGERRVKSSMVCEKLFGLETVRRAKTFFVYMHFRSEVQTMEFVKHCLDSGKTVTIPLTLSMEKRLLAIQITDPLNDVVSGYCGIPEPEQELVHSSVYDSAQIDVAIIPGSVFDRFGGRLGYGGGYYDRFLMQDAPKAVRIGISFEMQLIEKVPVQPHDQFMDIMVTEEKIYDCRRIRNAQDSRLS